MAYGALDKILLSYLVPKEVLKNKQPIFTICKTKALSPEMADKQACGQTEQLESKPKQLRSHMSN
jgi:hypothetical protein